MLLQRFARITFAVIINWSGQDKSQQGARGHLSFGYKYQITLTDIKRSLNKHSKMVESTSEGSF